MSKLIQSRIALVFFVLLILQGCGFSSGLYSDILKAQDLIDELKFEKAARIYEGILLKKPSKTIRIKINFQLGEIYSIYLSDYEKSIYYFNKIVNESNEPKWQVNALEKLANIYLNNTNNFDKAAASYLKLTKFLPVLDKNTFYNYSYGLSLLKKRKLMDSIKVFNKVLKEKNSNYSTLSYYQKGMAYFYLKKYDKALSSWFEYLKRERRNDLIVKAKFMIANAYESSEKLKEAYNIYYSILGEYPNAEVIQGRLESLYERRVARKR